MNVLVISPHPDDETLGAGGTLLKLKEKGHKTHWLNVTNMKTEYGYAKERVDERNEEIQKVISSYSFDSFWNMELEPTGMDKYETGRLVSHFKKVFEEVKPELLFLPFPNDIHSDHRIIFQTVYSCTKSFRAPYLKIVLSMEILSETDQAQVENPFVPNVFIDISQYLEKKINIMKIYKSEIDSPPFPRSAEGIKGLAAYRGATAYYKYSEAFYLMKGRMD